MPVSARVRNRGTFIASGGSFTQFNFDGTTYGGSSHAYASWPNASGTVESITDYPTPGYNTISKAGGVVNTAVSINRKTRKTSGAGWSYEAKSPGVNKPPCYPVGGQIRYGIGNGTGGALVPSPVGQYTDPIGNSWFLENAIVLAGTSANAAVAEASVMLGVDLGERRQTWKMLRNAGMQMLRWKRGLESINNLMKFKPHEARIQLHRNKYVKTMRAARRVTPAPTTMDFIANNWLALRYGVLPTIATIDGLLETAFMPTPPVRRTARGRAVANVLKPQTTISTFVVNLGGYGWNMTRTDILSKKTNVRAGILYEHHASFATQTGIGADHIPSTLYELIPWSFVLDWVVNVGQAISSAIPRRNVRTLCSWTTVETELTFKSTHVAVPYGNATCMRALSGPSSVHEEVVYEKTRTPGVASGLAIAITQFDIEKPMWMKRTADTFTLLHQAFRKL